MTYKLYYLKYVKELAMHGWGRESVVVQTAVQRLYFIEKAEIP